MDNNISTFLSDNVHEVLINLRSNYSCQFAVINDDLLFDWSKVDLELNNISGSECILNNSWNWYKENMKIVWAIMMKTDEKFKMCSKVKKEKLLSLSLWVFESTEIIDIFNKFETNGESELLFCILKLTSYLDRALGDVYTSSCGHVPFLLKDMLASSVLEEVFGRTQIKFIQLLMGSVKGLNIRNISWHGFFSPGEVHSSIVSTLIICIASLGVSVKDFKRRPLIKGETLMNFAQCLTPFWSDVTSNTTMFMESVKICPFIPKNHWVYWNHANNLYLQKCFGDFVLFLMPLKECLLRIVFCYANNCSERFYTAEMTSFYMTLDDILAPNIESKDNQLCSVIGIKMWEMLLDLYVYEEGPRLRDRISHSEIKPYDIAENITRCVFDVTVLLIISIALNRKGDLLQDKKFIESEYYSQLINLPLKYESQFHPFSLFKRSFLEIISRVLSWSELPRPQELSHLANGEHDKVVNLFNNATGTRDFSIFSHCLIKQIKNLKLATINRPKQEIELISMLRKILYSLETVHSNIVENCQMNFLHWKEKQMKSRKRENYKRMLECMFNIQFGFGCLFLALFVALRNLNDNKIEETYGKLKFFRACLKYSENAATMSSNKKNRWKELDEATFNICNVIVFEPFLKNNEFSFDYC